MRARLYRNDHDSSCTIIRFENITAFEIYADKDGRLSLDVEGPCLVDEDGDDKAFECGSLFLVDLRRLGRWHRRRSKKRMRQEMQRIAGELSGNIDSEGYVWAVTADGRKGKLASGIAESETQATSEAVLSLRGLGGDSEYKIWVNGNFQLAVRNEHS